MNSKYALLSLMVLIFVGVGLSAQNVGIGTATPLDRLHVAGNVRINPLAGAGIRMVIANAVGTLGIVPSGVNGQVLTQTVGGPVWQTASTDWSIVGNASTNSINNFIGTVDNVDLVMRTNSNERVRVTNTGLVGIGLGTPLVRLHVAGDVQVGPVNPANTVPQPSFGNRLIFSGGGSTSGGDSENTDPLWMARYNKAGDQTELRLNLSDNCTPEDAFVIQSGGYFCPVTDLFRFQADGVACKIGSGSWVVCSDQRLKHKIKNFSDGLEMLNAVRPVTFQYNGRGQTVDNGKEYVGVIAQELQQVAPYMVDSSGQYLTVDPSAFTFILINAVKEQQLQINQLQKELINTQSEFRRYLSESKSERTQIDAEN
jgi:hypothetical protein